MTPTRILVFVPNWVGDVVMATAAMNALRRRYPEAQIAHLMRPYVGDVLAGAGLADEFIPWPNGGIGSLLGLARRLRRERFDLAVLFTNSFRSALLARLARVTQRIGYARDGRGWLLTDRLRAPRAGGKYIPIPALDYYNALAVAAGCSPPGDQLVLATSPEDEAAVDKRIGARRAGDAPLVVFNPGANYGSAKCWPAEKYAALADRLVRERGARVVASLGPKERAIAERLAAATRNVEVCIDPPLGLGPLKALVRRCDLLVTNDTGPRHFAAAFGVPVVTVFGSSDPAWTDTRFARERNVMLKLDCQPCMKRTCPLGHHHCMNQLEPDLVYDAAARLLEEGVAKRTHEGAKKTVM
ncbi:MAG: ADP-heptose--LPS heptosyltransferase [Phycisphaerae bacterium]|nr:MAG: lipopolysaccharide heptosyltransferase II [Planctomycetia bacterium]RIK68640.1 MAG: lipopolysaccharide heptosyltransferase II [Planctomycetota bacterium]GJQ25553.1 MAG: ADP-heptose--LPS heptosyltransferase [Phycisphaerae bacterium]